MAVRAFLSFDVCDMGQAEAVRWKLLELRPGLDLLEHPTNVSFDSAKAQPIGAAIGEQIRVSDIFICLCGPKAWKSRWVDWELKMAQHLGKPILGVDLFSATGIGHHPLALEGLPVVAMDGPVILETMDRLLRDRRRG